jgi:hypothetical protein
MIEPKEQEKLKVFYQELATQMITDDHERDKLFEGVEDIAHAKWELPQQMKKLSWVLTMRSAEGADAENIGTNILSAGEPDYKFQPFSVDKETKKKARESELAVKYWMNLASKRTRSGIVSDLARSALRYDQICVQVVYIPWEEKARSKYGMSTDHLMRAKRFGPFIVSVRRPVNVHVRTSDMMTETVLFVNKMKISSAMQYWGTLGNKLNSFRDEKDPKWQDKTVYIYDMMDYRIHSVWAQLDPLGSDAISNNGSFIIDPEEHGIPFINWVVKIGGTSIETNPMYSQHPLLGMLYHTKAYTIKNIMDSLFVGEGVAHAGAPRNIISGTNTENSVVEYNDPGGSVRLPTGTTYEAIDPPRLDENLEKISAMLSRRIDNSTFSNILKGGQIPASMTFSGLNMYIQNALNQLTPYRKLTESALSDVAKLMLEWIVFNGEKETVWSMSKDNKGKEIEIDPKALDPEHLIVDVTLRPDVPVDKQQKVNTAAQAVKILGYTKEAALGDAGVDDPVQMLKEKRKEMLQETVLGGKLMVIQAQYQAEAMKLSQEAQQQMRDQIMAEMQSKQGMGQGFNPAMGGQPPAEANPNMTYENQTGETRAGAPLA